MKKLLTLSFFTFLSVITYGQAKNIIGAWLWKDSKTAFSLFIKEGNFIEKHIGPINEVILTKNIVHGSYKMINNKKIIISWADKTTEYGTIKLVDNFTLQIQLKDLRHQNALKVYDFKKIIDEEVKPD